MSYSRVYHDRGTIVFSPRAVTDRVTAYALYIDPPLGARGDDGTVSSGTERACSHREAPDDQGQPCGRKGRDCQPAENRMILQDCALVEAPGGGFLRFGGISYPLDRWLQ